MKKIDLTYFTGRKHLLYAGLFGFLLSYLSVFNSAYGYFIDEFYYIACALRPAFGYVDHPPLSPLILTVFQFIFGTSLYAIRFLPALAAAAAIFLTGTLAERAGGGKFSQLLAACAIAASPMLEGFAGFYSMNAFEPLLAIVLMHLTLRIIKENNPRLWLWSGVVMGLGVMNKHTFGVFIVALVLSLLLTGRWRVVFSRYFLFGGIIAFLIFAPNIIWQVLNGFPSLEFYRNISTDKNIYTPPVSFIIGQIIGMSPLAFPVWLTGSFYLLFSKKYKDMNFLAVLFILLFLFMMSTGTSRSDRLIFAYPGVIAGGALLIEALTLRYRLKWLNAAVIIFLIAGIAPALPLILPYFSYEYVAEYVKTIGFNTEIEKGKKPPLPQLLSDRIGWEDKVLLMQRAYNTLNDEEKKSAIMAGGNYGVAGALELYGRDHGFPFVGTSHNNYYLWSREELQRKNYTILLQMDDEESLEGYKRLFDSVEVVPGEFTHSFVSPHENHLRVFICRGPKMPILSMLEESKTFH